MRVVASGKGRARRGEGLAGAGWADSDQVLNIVQVNWGSVGNVWITFAWVLAVWF